MIWVTTTTTSNNSRCCEIVVLVVVVVAVVVVAVVIVVVLVQLLALPTFYSPRIYERINQLFSCLQQSFQRDEGILTVLITNYLLPVDF